jgi:hypothetical protein
MYEYATRVLQEQKGLKLTCSNHVEAYVGVKAVYGTSEEGHTTATLLQDHSPSRRCTRPLRASRRAGACPPDASRPTDVHGFQAHQ